MKILTFITILLCILLIFSSCASMFSGSENRLHKDSLTETDKLVLLTIQAINEKSPRLIHSHLSDDFTFLNFEQPRVTMVLDQVLVQLSEVVEYRKISESINNGDLTMIYEFDFSGSFGKRNVTFVFDENHLIKQFELLQEEVMIVNIRPDEGLEKPEQDIIIIPLTINKVAMTSAILNGESRNFVIDTGAAILTLNKKHIEDYQDTGFGVQGVSGTQAGTVLTQISDFDFYGITIKESNILAIDMSHIEERIGVEIYGIIGYNVFKDYDLLFDYENHTLTLLNPEITENFLETNFPTSTFMTIETEKKTMSPIPFIKGKIGGLEFNFAFDSGAGMIVIDMIHKDALSDFFTFTETRDARDIGSSFSAEAGNIDELIIGNKSFTELDSQFTDLSYLSHALGTQVDGLIGYEVLKNQKVLLSYANEQVVFID